VIEAARWAPSAYNAQPWRFVYALRGTSFWKEFISALLPFNAAWAQRASALIFVLSDTLITPPGSAEAVPARFNSFDAGAAWSLLALQATKLGLHTHAMGGFDAARAAEVIGSGERFRIEIAVALGRLGDPDLLPDTLRAREGPSERLPLHSIAFQGRITPE
jgi:nitroreductase